MSVCYEINGPFVQGEVLDGEAIVLHRERGHYFSTEGSGALIWAGIEQRAALGAICEALAAHYCLAADDARRAVDAFVAELESHDLIRTCNGPQIDAVTIPLGLEAGYSAPALEVYSDMQDLLLLDPLHGVDDMGWPLAAPQEAA